MSDSNELSVVIEDLSRRFAQWRQTRVRGVSRIPADLWGGAVELATRQGVHRTARALGLDFNALKKRMKVAPAYSRRSAEVSVATFVECLSPLSSDIAECVLQVESSGGAAMRIQMKNVTPLALSSIIRDFAR
jgi:hypothetical protein